MTNKQGKRLRFPPRWQCVVLRVGRITQQPTGHGSNANHRCPLWAERCDGLLSNKIFVNVLNLSLCQEPQPYFTEVTSYHTREIYLKPKGAHDRRIFDSDCWNRALVGYTCVSRHIVQLQRLTVCHFLIFVCRLLRALEDCRNSLELTLDHKRQHHYWLCSKCQLTFQCHT